MCAGTIRVHRGIVATLFFPAVLLLFAAWRAPSEIIFGDNFTQPVGNITNSVPFLDVEGQGWQLAPARSPFFLDGHGHILDTGTSGAVACVPLIPIGPHGSMTLTATVQIPQDATQWIGMGFANSNTVLIGSGSKSGPWVQVNGGGGITLYGGTGANNPLTVSNAFVNSGLPVQFQLTYNAFTLSTSVAAVSGGVTNIILDSIPVTNTLPAITARSLVFQSSAATPSPNRWIAAVSLDWFPRPPPMLSLPVPPASIVTRQVGAPTGTNDISLIQKALTFAVTNGSPTEVVFNSGATYIITNTSNVADMPLNMNGANNVIINGNGCQILIKNPRIGFLHLQNCVNAIIENFTVDYDPLPWTQGVVTRNLYTDPPAGMSKTPAIEVRVDTGYPAPTNANYIDANAVASAERWGIVMNTNFPGRGAATVTPFTSTTTSSRRMSTAPSRCRFPTPPRSKPSSPMISGAWFRAGTAPASIAPAIAIRSPSSISPTTPAPPPTSRPRPPRSSTKSTAPWPSAPRPAGATRGRIKSSNADGGYFGSTRIGPWVQGCSFTGLSDDVANAYTEPFVVSGAPAIPTDTFTLLNFNDGSPGTALTGGEVEVGDQLLFFDGISGEVFDQAAVLSTNASSVTVDHAISGLVNGNDETNTLVIDETLNTSAVYLDNHFSNSRIHGIYCRANNILIAHNSISGMGLSAISGFPALDLGSPNSFVPTNAIIMDNVLSDCSYSYEAINNAIPTDEPAFALIELHQTRNADDYVTNSLAISGVRILNNAFLNWRRAPLSLHNVTDVIVAGNYFGPPITSDGLVPLSADYVADLWADDYPNLTFAGNVNATGISNSVSIREDGNPVVISSAFSPLAAPVLASTVNGTNSLLNWSSAAPSFVLQQTNRQGAANGWIDVTNESSINAASNSVAVPRPQGTNQLYYRLRQR